jgi:hypothetical protein
MTHIHSNKLYIYLVRCVKCPVDQPETAVVEANKQDTELYGKVEVVLDIDRSMMLSLAKYATARCAANASA